MSDLTAGDWEHYKTQQRLRREKRLPLRSAAILQLNDRGYTVRQLTPYCFRVNNVVDLYPIHNRWHDLRTNTRGGTADLVRWVKENVHHEIALPLD